MLPPRLGLTLIATFWLLSWATIASAQFGVGQGGGGQGGAPPQGQAQQAPGTAGGSDVDELGGQLRDADPTIRLEAVKALADANKDEDAIQHLIDATADVDTRVRLKAIDCLGEARASAATPVLVQTLYLRDSKPWLKQRVLVALGKIGDPRAAKPIADFLERDAEANLIGTAIFSLGEIGNEGSIPALRDMAQGTENERLALLANDAIGKIQQRQVNPEIEIQALRPQPGDIQRPASASAGAPLAGF
ncbi:MAG: HEAT repeat domain-containing protein [Candidatus Binatia bacterium]|nr:HEAT repeat domain-containing protein [Candidatus Binatia bacterium]